MIDEILFDANILCHAFNEAEPAKRRVCEKLVEDVFDRKIRGVVSNQILIEFFNASTRKLGFPVEKSKKIVKSFIVSERWHKINYSHNTITRAIDNSEILDVPFLDLLIIETMKENGIAEIITENEKDFSKIPGIRVTNPFKS